MASSASTAASVVVRRASETSRATGAMLRTLSLHSGVVQFGLLGPATLGTRLRCVHHGICLANIGSFADPRVAVRFARAAEANGWDGVFVWDHLAFVWGPPAADPWITLAAIASSTERVRLGTMVTPVARRRPHVLAQQV